MTTSNDEIAVLLAAISKQMTQQGQLIRKMWVEMTGLAPTADDLKPKKEMPKKDLIITDDPNHGQLDKLPRETPKFDMNRKHKIRAAPCDYCGGNITWDYYKKDVFTMPVHVDAEGKIIGNGGCPNYAEGS